MNIIIWQCDKFIIKTVYDDYYRDWDYNLRSKLGEKGQGQEKGRQA